MKLEDTTLPRVEIKKIDKVKLPPTEFLYKLAMKISAEIKAGRDSW